MIRWEPEEEQAATEGRKEMTAESYMEHHERMLAQRDADLAQIEREKLRRVLRAALGREPTGEEMDRALEEWEG